ncbi:MAG TPA: hypothetical protein VKN14_00715 [Flavobacteriaceae bacterium]|nr:hypothetical protein [Flavobacteriaceae bacterium]
MKTIKIVIFIIAISISFLAQAQDFETSNKTQIDKQSYYKQRAEEDAKFEQQFNAETETDEKAFWKEQKNYERNLKRKDKKAYKAYMKGKRDAYASHYNHCNNHCHHSDYYYHHASFYYYRYDGYYHKRYPRRSLIKTRVSIGSPRVGIGIL